jgi:hypothetical protein
MSIIWESVTPDELKIGDTISVWWGSGRDTITDLKPYVGPLSAVLGEGTKLASFALFKTGMTLSGKGRYNRIKVSCSAT